MGQKHYALTVVHGTVKQISVSGGKYDTLTKAEDKADELIESGYQTVYLTMVEETHISTFGKRRLKYINKES